ncbi:VIT1/CCC1 transporter family protein [Candidatus Woesearchaeota archaeon]|nr:VIT1/CCC1 transporter family protein [Candidatus Woesearchaeota archaeon]
MADNIRDIILGGQDGLVNVLGLVLGVAAATMDTRTIIISGLAGTFAESISMAAVTYTGFKAARDVGKRKYKNHHAKKYLMTEYGKPFTSAIVVGISSLLGSILPIISFFALPVEQAMYSSVIIAIIVLFIIGSTKGILARQEWYKTGIEMAIIGTIAALAGFIVGEILKKIFI